MDIAAYIIKYTDRHGNDRRPWIVNASSAVEAVRFGFASQSPSKSAAAAMYGRPGVCHSHEHYRLLMADGREHCMVLRQD